MLLLRVEECKRRKFILQIFECINIMAYIVTPQTLGGCVFDKGYRHVKYRSARVRIAEGTTFLTMFLLSFLFLAT